MIALDEHRIDATLTLGHRLAEGPIPLTEAMRYAMMLAEALRQIHDSGRICGALVPSNIDVSGGSLEVTITPVEELDITPYTAPEILQGQVPDSRSDIFAFGAILHELVVGRRAFDGDSADALAVSLQNSVPPTSGNAALDHLIGNCVAKDPAVRCQRMKKVILELKLLTIVPRAEAVTRQLAVKAALRAQTEQLETRVTAQLHTQEQAIIDAQQVSGDAISELRGRLSHVEAEQAPLQERSVTVEAMCQSVMKHLEQVQQTVDSIEERLTSLREELDSLSHGAAVMEQYTGARMHEFEQALKSQRIALASVAASQEQTDDVVEGVVGAMELVHTIVFDKDEAFR